MAIRVSLSAVLAVIGAAAGMSPFGSALAQGTFIGSWTVAALAKPDWIEPTSSDPLVALKVGDKVEFNADSVSAIEPFGCSSVKYEQIKVPVTALFQGGIPDPAVAASVAQRFGITGSTPTLRATCENATVDYHKAGSGLVMQFDNMIYTFTKTAATR